MRLIKSFIQKNKLILRQAVLNKAGVGIAMAMVAGVSLALGGLLVLNSDRFFQAVNSEQKRKDIVSSIMEEINSTLADRNGCVAAMNANFNNVGLYQAFPYSLSSDNSLSIQSIGVIPDPGNTANQRTIAVRFRAIKKPSGQVQDFLRRVQVEIFSDPNGAQYCMSIEQGGGSISVSSFCGNLGGQFVNNQCTFNAAGNNVLVPGQNFTNVLRLRACQLLGGSYVNGRCDSVNVAGSVHSDRHFPGPGAGIDEVRLTFPITDDRRESFSVAACGLNEIATGYNADGSLSCLAVDCNSSLFLSDPTVQVFSTYAPTQVNNGLIECRCLKDFRFGSDPHTNSGARPVPVAPPVSPFPQPLDYGLTGIDNNNGTVGCADSGGAPDPFACADYLYDDGCGTGTTCTVERGRFPGCCVTTTSEKYVIVNSCNDICAVGPGCNADVNNPGAGCSVTTCPASPTAKCAVSGSATAPNSRTCIASAEAGEGSVNVPGNCGGGVTGSCTMDCAAGGTWTVSNSQVNACVTLPVTCDNSQIDDAFSSNLGIAITAISPTVDNAMTPLVNEMLYTEVGDDFVTNGGTLSCVSGTGSGLTATCSTGGVWTVTGSCTPTTCDSFDVSDSNSFAGSNPSVSKCNSDALAQRNACLGLSGCYLETGTYSDLCSQASPSNRVWEVQCTSNITCQLSNIPTTANTTYTLPSAGALGYYGNNTGQTYTGTCNSGYSGSPSVTCQADGTWSTSGSCTVSSCLNSALTFPNANYSTSGSTSDTSSISGGISCNNGFTGTPSAICNNGTWNTTGSCTATCNDPPLPAANAVNCGTTQSNCHGSVTGTRCSNVFQTCNAGNCECFVAGTKITMADGSLKNIEDVQVGDRLRGVKHDNTVLSLKPSFKNGNIYSINGSGFFVTAGHPFMTKDGWKAFDPKLGMEINPALEISKLEIGDTIIRIDGEVLVEQIDFEYQEVEVYNFEVSGEKVYYADGFLVHNK